MVMSDSLPCSTGSLVLSGAIRTRFSASGELEDRALGNVFFGVVDQLEVALFQQRTDRHVARRHDHAQRLLLLRRDRVGVVEPGEQQGGNPGGAEQQELFLTIHSVLGNGGHSGHTLRHDCRRRFCRCSVVTHTESIKFRQIQAKSRFYPRKSGASRSVPGRAARARRRAAARA